MDLPKPGHSQEELVLWLEQLLKLTDWAPSKLAAEAGVAPSTVNRFLAGAGHLLSNTTVARIESAAINRIRQRVASGEIPPISDGTSASRRMVHVSEIDPRSQKETMSWGFPEQWFKFQFDAEPDDCRVIPVEDDAMAPYLNSGDRVVVNLKHTAPSPAGHYVIDDGVGYQVRRIEVLPGVKPASVSVRARNPDYLARELPLKNLKIIGRVVGMWRRV